jgi:hypothetical protein
MSQKYKVSKIGWHIHKQALHIMLVLKSGEMSPIITNLIFGHLVASFMKCAIIGLPSKGKIYNLCLRVYRKERMSLFHPSTLVNYLISSTYC